MSSTIIAKNIQVGTSGTATNNFTWYQPAAPDGTIRLGVGTYGATTLDALTVNGSGTLTAPAFSGSGASLTALNASNLSSGTVPDARFPATLPAASGANLTNLNASNLDSGTIPNARFPATLPAASGANLTNLNASNLSSGTVATARLGTGTANSTTFLRGDGTWAVAGGDPTTTQVLNATAGAALGAVGSYALLSGVPGGLSGVGDGITGAGSSLRYMGFEGSSYNTGGTPSGTWRCMGFYSSSGGQRNNVWLRIS
jgi:hypothetical protein